MLIPEGFQSLWDWNLWDSLSEWVQIHSWIYSNFLTQFHKHYKCLLGRVTEAWEAQPGSVEAVSWLTQEVLTDPQRKWWNMERGVEITPGQTVKCVWKKPHRISEGWGEVCVELGESGKASFGRRPYVLLVFIRAVFDECWSPQSWWQLWIPQQHTNRQFCIYWWSLWVGRG